MEAAEKTIETERRNRIKVAVWAYAYEIVGKPLVTDSQYDQLCREINPLVKTGNDLLDTFFSTEFSPATGIWIHKHPELDKVKRLYCRLANKALSS